MSDDVPKATGFAVVHGGRVDVASVAATARAAFVNFALAKGVDVTDDHSDDDLRQAMERGMRAYGCRLVEVEITVVPREVSLLEMHLGPMGSA